MPPARPRLLALVVPALLALAAPAGAQQGRCTGAGEAIGADPAVTRSAVACVVNGIRTDAGLPAVSASARLSLAAQRHASDMAERGYFEHVSPEGATLQRRVTATGYLRGAPGWELGEDIAWAEPLVSPAAVVDAWMASPTHRDVILTGSFRAVGVGVAPGLPRAGGGAGTTLVMDFGVRRRAGASALARRARASR